MNLDSKILNKYCKDVSKKSILAVKEPEVVNEFLKYIQLQNEIMSKSNAYEIASTMNSFDFWYKQKNSEPKRNVATHRDVYYVDLGAYNLKYEEGFIHPCLVIRSYGSNLLVIPGSTKKYGKKDHLIFDIKAYDGFTRNTGLMLDQTRCVSSTRLRDKLGRVTPDTYTAVLNKFMEKFLCKQYDDFNELKRANGNLEDEFNVLKKDYEDLKDNSDMQKLEFDKLKKEYELLKKSN